MNQLLTPNQPVNPTPNIGSADDSSPERNKLSRRQSRRSGLFAPELTKAALKQSFLMLRPDIQWKNPVMFVVEVGTALTIAYTVAVLLGYQSQATVGYLLALDVWLFLTVLFANFASALAEARGKAQADALRKTRQETPAYRLTHREDAEAVLNLEGSVADLSRNGRAATLHVEATVSTALKAGDLVVIDAGQF